MDHNAACLPPRILHNHCFQFLLGITVVPREIQDNGYAKFFCCENGKLRKMIFQSVTQAARKKKIQVLPVGVEPMTLLLFVQIELHH